ncbi:hypothetical protein KM043_010774 [Ampulex compressa]|nr:hypothetical protein KM043_010774 [Ampulex compressa]
MGKKDKNKKKVSGAVKTALKTEKKLSAKQKKELATLGEEDIEKVVAEIEREEARRQRVVEATIGPPSRRVNFTLTTHPFKEELIMLGGEFHDGRTTVVYGDMFNYNLSKKEWVLIKAPGAPPPRCGHQAVATCTNKGELWVFGGEFSSPSESQFYHYRDLWVYRIGEKKWEKILAAGGPSARSGHRMTHIKKHLIVFGGFHDNLRDYKYYNDIHMFSLETYTWLKLEVSGIPPAPRSGCIVLPTPDNRLLVYGGYSKTKIKKDVDKGSVHSDMYLLVSDKNDVTGLKWKWQPVKQTGVKPSPRCSTSGILVQSNLAYIFGGVLDQENDEEELHGTFYNDLMALDLEKFQWHEVTLSGKKDATSRRRRRKANDGDESVNTMDDENNSENDETIDTLDEPVTPTPEPAQSVVTDEDGIFTVTVGPTMQSGVNSEGTVQADVFFPSPRINCGLAVKHSVLYLYGGMFEDGDRQYTLNDLYSLDCRKLDEWRTIITDDISSQPWYESSSSSSDGDDTNDSDEDEDERMDIDENQ